MRGSPKRPSLPLPAPELAREFRQRLSRWYRQNARDLPWRRTRDPYRVLVSELMLQQTQVSRVIGYYNAFLRRFPTLRDVARARPSQVREAWDGLGYYARARNLQELARTIHRDGAAGNGLPDDPARLRELPGIGRYTAGAVASFAYERRAALVDTNVSRVLRRVFAPGLPRTAASEGEVWRIAEAILPRTGRATWTHNQAVMELGALVCSPRRPKCQSCCVRRMCGSLAGSAPDL